MTNFKLVGNRLPPLGVPLMVKTADDYGCGEEQIKYPVYYAKNPYNGKYCWYFFPACEGITQLLPEYSTVTEWMEIF